MEQNPLVSVIIATHNRAELLVTRAVPSVLNQTYQNFELIIVADRCTDDTRDRVQAIKDPRIKFVELTDRPPLPDDLHARWRVASAAPRNKGLEIATGEWLTFLDDDDEFTPDHIELLLKKALEGYDFVYGNILMITPNGEQHIIGKYPPEHGHIGASSFICSAKYKHIKFNTDATATWEPGDWNFIRRVIEAGARVCYINEVVYIHYLPVRAWEREQQKLPWTGERFLPWIPGAQIHYEHLHRCAFASQFVKGKRVLDLASGEGYGANMLAKQAEHVIGIEIDKSTVEHARAKYVRSNLEFIQGSILDVPIRGENLFDVITCFEAIEHIAEHDKLLSEVKRLLKEDGIFILSTPNKAAYSDAPSLNNPFHVRELYFDEFQNLLKRYFKHLQLWGQRVYAGSNIWALPAQERSTSREFLVRKGDLEFYMLETPLDGKEPMFFVAMASDAPLEHADYRFSSWLVDTSNILLNDYETQIVQLNASLQEKETQIAQLNASLQEKETQIAQLNASLQEKETQLQQIHQGIVMQLLNRYQRIAEKIFPAGTRRRYYYELVLTGIRVLLNEGWRSFWRKLWRWLSFHTGTGISSGQRQYYQTWVLQNEPTAEQLEKQRQVSLSFPYRPKISIITPVWNPEPRWLKAAVESVLCQTYDNWELCLADANPKHPIVRKILQEYTMRDKRIKVKPLPQNYGIAQNSNEALSMATGEFIALLDQDDELAPFALYEVAKLLNENPAADFIYTDEDKIDAGGRRFDPFFKPDWSPDLLHSFMYTGHLSVYARSLIDEVGGFRPEFELSQDYDLTLRASEKARCVAHIPKVLYHWRTTPGSAAAGGKAAARTSNIKALAAAVQRRGYKGSALVAEKPFFVNRIKYHLEAEPLVSIIVPTDSKTTIIGCIDSILARTKYSNYEIVVVTNSNLALFVQQRYRTEQRVRTVEFDRPFNFSAKCNEGAKRATGDYLLFLNDDIEVLHSDWLEEMVSFFQRPEVGAVGPKLVYPDNTIQHAGLVTGVRGLVGTAFHRRPMDSSEYFCLIQSTRNVAALSAACLLTTRTIFQAVGGFDEVNTPVRHSDVDLCFRIRERGYLLVYTPFVALKHVGHESLRKVSQPPEKQPADLYLLKRWPEFVASDPYYTHNMRGLLYEDRNWPYRLIASRRCIGEYTGAHLIFVSHDLSLSGAPLAMYSLATRLKKERYFITVAAPVEGELVEALASNGIPVILDSSILESPLDETRRFLANYDVVVANTILSWRLVYIAKAAGTRVVWMIHEGQFGRSLAEVDHEIAKALDIADVVVFPSRYVAEIFRGLGSGTNFEVANPSVDVPDGGTPSPPAKPANRFIVLHVGSIEPRKGQETLVRCISKLPPELAPNFEFHFVGRVLDHKYYSKLRDLLTGSTGVHFHGQVERARLFELYSMADVFVCTSQDEPFGLVILEAMAHKKPVVASNVGGIPEIIEKGHSGILVPAGDPEALLNTLVNLYRDADYRNALADNAHQRFKAFFTPDRYATRFLDILQKYGLLSKTHYHGLPPIVYFAPGSQHASDSLMPKISEINAEISSEYAAEKNMTPPNTSVTVKGGAV